MPTVCGSAAWSNASWRARHGRNRRSRRPAAVEELTANIRQTAENASATEEISVQAAERAERAGRTVTEAVDAMQTIAEKITIVREIARQTDLLALNAAVEAARR